MQGHCFCKRVKFEITGVHKACVNCHCESCRRQCSAPMTTYIGVEDANWHWTGEPPSIYKSSEGVERTFCEKCGTPMSFRSERMSDVMHFYVASLENPESVSPSLHVASEEKLSWLKLNDGLPCSVGPDYTNSNKNKSVR